MTEDKTKFSLPYLVKGKGKQDWYKALGNGWRIGVMITLTLLLLFGAMQVWSFFFPKTKSNVNKPTAFVLPMGRVENLDQRSIQISMEEKSWEAGVYVGSGQYDNKMLTFIGFKVSRKW